MYKQGSSFLNVEGQIQWEKWKFKPCKYVWNVTSVSKVPIPELWNNLHLQSLLFVGRSENKLVKSGNLCADRAVKLLFLSLKSQNQTNMGMVKEKVVILE